MHYIEPLLADPVAEEIKADEIRDDSWFFFEKRAQFKKNFLFNFGGHFVAA